MKASPEEVEADGERLGAEHLEQHDAERDGPERQQHEVRRPRQRAAGPERERHVHGGHHVHHVRQEDEVRDPVVLAAVDLFLEREGASVQGAAEQVVERHEQAVVAVLLLVVQAQVPACTIRLFALFVCLFVCLMIMQHEFCHLFVCLSMFINHHISSVLSICLLNFGHLDQWSPGGGIDRRW